MTVSNSAGRHILFRLCKEPVGVLLKLNQDHFGNSVVIQKGMSELTKSLVAIRKLGIRDTQVDQSKGFGDCYVCETEILRRKNDNELGSDDPWTIYCPKCHEDCDQALGKLADLDFGFRTAGM